jgi:hypothetical protein
MDNPGVYPLFASNIATAMTSVAQTAIDDLDGEESVTFIAEVFGTLTGGATIDLLAQTTFDGGTTWYDVGLFHFTAGGMKYGTISRKAGGDVQAYAALIEEGFNHGLLGQQLRAVVSASGTFSGVTASLRAHAS